MDNLELYDKVRVVPENAKKPIKGGRLSGMTEINAMWRIKTLTEQFGPCGIGWYYKTTNKWLEKYGELGCAAFVDIELFVKDGDEWSKPISGTGGSMFASKEKDGIHISDECYKMATTDAISVACKQLGIGADVYWNTDVTKYTKQETPPPPEQSDDNDDTQWCCEQCGKPFEKITFKGKTFTRKEVFYNRKSHSETGSALCKECTEKLGA